MPILDETNRVRRVLYGSLAGLALAACAHTPAATAVSTPPAGTSGSVEKVETKQAQSRDPGLAILLRPSAQPSPRVHVEIDLDASDAELATWRVQRGSPERVTNVAARDGKGELTARVVAAADGAANIVLGRRPEGAVHLGYDVLAGDAGADDPVGILVLEDRFRGAGEGLVALPAAVEDAVLNITLTIDPEPLRVRGAASSLGAGRVRSTKARPRALRYATFMAGSLGSGAFDGIEGHDEGAWLGYTAFDPRPAIAELAQMRTAFGELFKADVPLAPWTYLFMSQARPIGSFSTTPRAGSTLVLLGPDEAWGAPLRVAIAQQLVRPWIGGELRIAPESGDDAQAWWFSEGVARHVAIRVLGRLGLLTPNQWRDTLAGELSVLATSPHRALGNTELSALAQKGNAVARATLAARGALYAAREGTALRARARRAKQEGQRDSLEGEILALLLAARSKVQPGQQTRSTITAQAWIDALSKDDPDAAKTFDSIVVRGEPVILPADALGPCFRASNGNYMAYDPGFDVEKTRADRESKVVGVRPDGPAAKAGLRDGDVLESMKSREGNADIPVKLVVTRAGTKVNVSYAPRGIQGRGQTWTRTPGISDERCGDPP
ncbi:hypothetical protein LZC95_38320 [Pendulispora brunnea]|uniref:PDZ domain-containing protein n=1 Tax=Pendulispora brunnea TaxID=2905690 RepID=A0ABZ2K2I8_9BACT